VHAIEAKRQAFLNRHGGLCAIAGIPIAHAQAERETLTAHAKTQEHLFEIIMSIFAVPISRTRRDWPVAPVRLLLISPIEGDRRRILVQPGGRDGIDLQGIEGDGPKYLVEMNGEEGIENLSQSRVMDGGALEPRLQQGQHPPFFQAGPHLVEGMMAIENRQEQGFYSTATREDMRGVRRAKGIDERSHLELAYHSQHQR
jgi:hypothetical protein